MANAWPRKRFFSLTVLKNYRAWLNFQSRLTFSHFRYGFKFSTGNAPPNCLCPRWIMHPTPAQIQMDGHVTIHLLEWKISKPSTDIEKVTEPESC